MACLLRNPTGKIQAYQRKGHRAVTGWLDSLDIDLISELSSIQMRLNASGAVGEIGVAHGRLFILLHLLCHEGEKSICVDVFDRQELNVDNSGSSAEHIFLSNVSKHAGHVEEIEILRGSSDKFSPGDIVSKVGPVRLFSIDGGHTKKLTMNDLSLADNCLTNLGAVLLDDPFHYQWPGVSEGLHAYLQGNSSNIKPFAISRSKLYLCRPNAVKALKPALKEVLNRFFLKETTFMGYEVDIYWPGPDSRYQRFMQSEHWLELRTTLIGRLLRAARLKFMPRDVDEVQR